jgi:hypothetical protein
MLRGHKGDDMDPAAIAALVTRLGGLKGVAMKAGQMLGYIDTSVPPELQAMLSLLQTAAPGTDFAGVEATLRAALGERADPLLAGIDRTPVAVASVGQVHHARLADGRELAVKVRHPGIEAALAADFRSAGVGKLFAALSGAASITANASRRRARPSPASATSSARPAHQQHFAHIFRDDPVLVIPEVLPELCATPVLVTRWTPGRSLATFLAGDPTQAERDAVGAALFRFWLRSFYRDGLFHADPHPGNFAFLPDGRIVLYDFGCVRRFDPALRRGFARLAAATRDNDEDGLLAAITAIGGHAPKDRSGRAHVRTLLRAFFAPLLTPGKRRVDPPTPASPAAARCRTNAPSSTSSSPGACCSCFASASASTRCSRGSRPRSTGAVSRARGPARRDHTEITNAGRRPGSQVSGPPAAGRLHSRHAFVTHSPTLDRDPHRAPDLHRLRRRQG